MTKLAPRIATGIAILGLAGPAFAATTSKSTTTSTPVAQTSVVHNPTHKHKKVASATEKKTESKKTEKKVEKKAAVKTTKTETPAAPSATPAPASK